MRKIATAFALIGLIVLAEFLYAASSRLEKKENWPSLAEWQMLNKKVGGRLIQVESLMSQCADDQGSKACLEAWDILKNPYSIQAYPWGTQSTGWLEGWSPSVSPYAVAAEITRDIVSAVKFARKHNLKLVVKGTGHDYLGRSNAANSLLVWTHKMKRIDVHDAFIPRGAPGETEGVPAVSVEAGVRWGEVYQVVTTEHGRYVQGGGCTSVGAAGGFLQGGGFGSFSKQYGIAAGSLLEAEVITADGKVRIANAYQNEDLFWALKGGGGGTFGIVAKATLQTHELPNFFGIVQGRINAHSERAYLKLIEQFIHFYQSNLFNPHWGEQVVFKPDNSLEIQLAFQGLTQEEAEKVWRPFMENLEKDRDFSSHFDFHAVPAAKFWDLEYWKRNHPSYVKFYQNGDEELFYWTANLEEVAVFWETFQSRWIPASLFEKENAARFAQILFSASRDYEFSLHFNKGLAGGSEEALKMGEKTSMNPAVLDAAALVIFASAQENVYPGIPGHEPDTEAGKAKLVRINKAMRRIVEATPDSGAYLNEADYFQENWQEAFWGRHYPRLLQIKKEYDPDNFFRCHHCVGS